MRSIVVFVPILLSVEGFLVRKVNNSSESILKYSSPEVCDSQEDVVNPLFLTPLLEQGRIQQARELSRVTPDIAETESYSGYFTVDQQCESNLFFWFFPAQKNWLTAPLVLWLQGGPGAPSTYGLLQEIGPIIYNENLEKTPHSWNVENNLLFIDQPVGTGYSFTVKECYAENDNDVAKELYSALLQFYQIFNELNSNKFIIAGESYAGHYIPYLGHLIHKRNPSARIKINLSGMMIGNGWFDSLYQSNKEDYLYQLGLIDNKGRKSISKLRQRFLRVLIKEDWENAYHAYADMENLGFKLFGHVNLYNYLMSNENPCRSEPWSDFLQNPETGKSLHVGNHTFIKCNTVVRDSMGKSIMQSVKPLLEELLEHYPIVFYFGQLDIKCAYPMAVQFLRSLQWSGAGDYQEATRHQWCVEDQLAGYYKSSHNLHEVLVRAVGHAVPKAQPLWAHVLANSVTTGSPFSPLQSLSQCPDG